MLPAESLSSRCAGLGSDVTSLGVGARVVTNATEGWPVGTHPAAAAAAGG